MSKYVPMAPRCVVCDHNNVIRHNTMCQNCEEAYDKLTRRDCTTIALIRWAAGRARRLERRRWTK